MLIKIKIRLNETKFNQKRDNTYFLQMCLNIMIYMLY